MKITLLHIILCLAIASANAQNKKAFFTLKDIKLSVPAFLPGIMEDTSVIKQNDTLLYSLHGQLFINAPLMIDNLPLPYPWKVIGEMVTAYTQENKDKIADLYDSKSKQKINDLLNGSHSKEMMNYVQNASVSNLRILAGIAYKEGFMIYTKDDTYGLHENYMVIENGKYKLSALEDSSPIGWNVGLYFKFEPKELSPAEIITPDSLNINHIKQLTVSMADPARWIAIYAGDVGEPVQLLVQDNGINDLDPDPLKIKFNLAGRQFIRKGNQAFYIASSNYPIQKISRQMLLPALKRKITIY